MNALTDNRQARVRAAALTILAGLALICLGLAVYLGHHTPTGWEMYTLAVLPTFPIVALVIIVGKQLSVEKDEFQRDLKVRSILWGTGAVLAWSAYSSVLRAFGWVDHLAVPFGEIGFFCWVTVAAKFFYGRANRPNDE